MIDFDPKKHQYSKAGVVYDSVTSVIAKYENPFDSQYWSTYKAVKDVMIQELGEVHWVKFKRAAGGWEKVVDHYKKNGHGLHRKIADRKAQYLRAWDVKAHNARVTGTAVHSWKEKAVNGSKSVVSTASGKTITLSVSQGVLLEKQGFVGDSVYAELVISNDHYRVAGMADIVEKHGDTIHIKDHKTSGKIELESFQGMMMKYPLESLPDSNYYHYQMQFSFYAWMLAQQGFKVGSLTLNHLLPPDYDDATAKPYTLKYRGDLVELMLRHYRGELKEVKKPVVANTKEGLVFNF